MDMSSEPLYPFGHGLSYTTFHYGQITASIQETESDGTVKLQVPVTNTGARDGMETVFWYVKDPYASLTRPEKELKYFEKRLIKAGSTEIFTFEADAKRDFGFYDADGNRLVEPGEVYVIVGDRKIRINIK